MKKFVDGVIVDMTDEEIAARQAEEKEWADGAAARNLSSLREERNRLLAETDWLIVMHKEKGTNIPTAWKTYRQELRDITNDYTSLDDVVWPEKP
tara:strand:- start:223 stop:507 length:285 start_codon:yes stop_codon:yes gene_type:complete